MGWELVEAADIVAAAAKMVAMLDKWGVKVNAPINFRN